MKNSSIKFISEKDMQKVVGGGKGKWIPIIDGLIDGAHGFWDAAKNSNAHLGKGPLGGGWK